MKTILLILFKVFILILVAVISFKISDFRAKRRLYSEDLEVRLVNVEIFRDALEKLNENEHDKAVSMLETAMLMEACGFKDDEKVLGWNGDMQNSVNKVAGYCSKYKVFDSKTNLPSHLVAKRFLNLHVNQTAP